MASVYIDVLFAVNFIINILLIEASGVITATYPPRWRVLLSSLLGALYAVCVFFPRLGILYTFAMKIAFSALIVLCAYKIRSARHFFALWGAFYAVSFVFGGCVIAVVSMTSIGRRTGAVYSNGVLYLNLPWQALLASTLFAYVLTVIVGRIRKKKIAAESVKREVEIFVSGQRVRVPAIIDTGNALFDPITGAPVIVCEYERIKDAFPESGEGESVVENLSRHGIRTRFVPYSSVGTRQGVMAAFKPDMVAIDKKIAQNCLIGLCETRLSSGSEYGALLNPQIVLTKNRGTLVNES